MPHRGLEIGMPVSDPVSRIAGIAGRTGLTEKTGRMADAMPGNAQEKGKSTGKDPTGTAAAAPYLACIGTGENAAQRGIPDASGMRGVTAGNRCNSLRQNVGFFRPRHACTVGLKLSPLSTNYHFTILTKQGIS